MNGITNEGILNHQVDSTIPHSVNNETSDSQVQISVNNNELVIYQDVDGEYKTLLLSPQQMAELGLLVQTSPAFQTVPSQCRVINTVPNQLPDINNGGVQLMASSFQPISLSQVNNFTTSNDENMSDSATPQYISNEPKKLPSFLYRNSNSTISITEPFVSNPLLLPGTVLLNNKQSVHNILQFENATNGITDNNVQSTNGENKLKEVVSLTSINSTKEKAGIVQGQVIQNNGDSNIVNDVIGNINVPITLQADGNLLPVRIANGNISKIKKSAARHTTVHLLKTGQSFHSMEHLDSEKLKAVTTAVNSVGNVTINKNYSMFDPATKTRIIYRLVYPEDLKLNNYLKAKKHGRRARPATDNTPAQPPVVPPELKVTRSGRTVRLPRHMGDALQKPLNTLPKKKMTVYTCAHCSQQFRGVKRMVQHYEIHPQHRPPEVINSKPVNLQPVKPKPVNLLPANPKPVKTKPANSQAANPQPANSQPTDAQSANPQSANPQPANSHLTNSHPVNPQPVNSQPAQESEPADKNLNLFDCLLNILEKTTKDNRAMVFVQQLETLLVRLRSLMPCMIGPRGRRHGSLCSINKELGRVFDVAAGNYTLDMDALKCNKDMEGTCHHLSTEITLDNTSDDCNVTDNPEVPCSRTHPVEDWPLANKRVWNTNAKINSITTQNSWTNQNGGSVSDVKSKVYADDNLRFSNETNTSLNVTDKDKQISIKNENKANTETSNSTVVGFQELGDSLIGMFTYDSNNAVPLTSIQSPDPIDLDDVSEHNPEADNYQFHSSHFKIRSSPIKRSPGSLSKIQINRESSPNFVKLTEQKSSFALPDVITSIGDSSKTFTERNLQPIPVCTQARSDLPIVASVLNNAGGTSYNLADRNSHKLKDMTSAMTNFPVRQESLDLNVSPVRIPKRRKSLSPTVTEQFAIDNLQDNLIGNDLHRTNAYLTNSPSINPQTNSNKTMSSHTVPDVKVAVIENHLESTDSYLSIVQSPDTKTETTKTKISNTLAKGKKRKKVKKSLVHPNFNITDSYLSNIHSSVPQVMDDTIIKSEVPPENLVGNELDKTDSFFSNLLSPNGQVMVKDTVVPDSSSNVKKRKIRKKVMPKGEIPTEMFLSHMQCTNGQVSNATSSILNSLSSEKMQRLSVDTNLGRSDPILSSVHPSVAQASSKPRNNKFDTTNLYLTGIHSPNAQISTNEDMITGTFVPNTIKGHRQRNSMDDEIDRADSYLTNIHLNSLNEQTRQNESITLKSTSNGEVIKNKLDVTDSIFMSIHSSEMDMRSNLADTDLDRTNSYLTNVHSPNVQMTANQPVISDSLPKGHRRRILVDNENDRSDSFLTNIHSSNALISRNEAIISDNCANRIMQENLDKNDRDRTDSYLLNIRPTQTSNDTMISNNLTNRNLQKINTDGRRDSIYSSVHLSDNHSSNLEVTKLDRNESFLSNLHSTNAQMSSDVTIISESLANVKKQSSLVDTDLDRAEAFLANMHSSDAQMSSNETDSMSEVKMGQNEGLLSVNESSLDSGRLSSLQLLDLSLSFTDAASSQMSLDLPLDLFPYHHP